MPQDEKDTEQLDLIQQQLTEAVLEAARYLESAAISGDKPQVSIKSDNSLVMNLDLESQRIILESLSGTFPIVAEEDPQSHSLINSHNDYFLVDPLDGTTTCKRFLGERGGQVGYGPLAGFVHNGQLSIAVFYSVPHRRLFSARKGSGCYLYDLDGDSLELKTEPRRLVVKTSSDLGSAAALFFVGKRGECRLIEALKTSDLIETAYRFGGFANDCTRLAQGFEQIQIQFMANPWDFAAVLFAAEAGCSVFCDPLGRRVKLESWKIEHNNPVVIVAPGLEDALFKFIDEVIHSS
jgi:fructose-1,6-bisphosphatase/inositol monophosphatase family enzyme